MATRLLVMPQLRLALAQTNPCLGDFSQNVLHIVNVTSQAYAAGADVVAFGEMSLVGYPIEDLATRPDFLIQASEALSDVALKIQAAGAGSIPVIVGFPHGPLEKHHSPFISAPQHSPVAIAHNSAAIIQDGRVIGLYHKHHLPNYSVFDEFRTFRPGNQPVVLHVAGCDVALAICEDIWQEGEPLDSLARAHPGLLLVLNGSPYEREKDDVRLPLVQRRAEQLRAPVAYVNLVGGQDDLVFDGDSFVVNSSGKLLARAKQFAEDLLIVDIDVRSAEVELGEEGISVVSAGNGHPNRTQSALEVIPPRIEEEHPPLQQLWDALVLGLRDYVEKNSFPSVILGLSGGIDSAVCAALAVDALGADRVFGVSMPSVFSSDHSQDDAADLAQRLGLNYRVEPISGMVSPVEGQLDLSGVAAENLQARTRGVILMSLSNTEGHLVLTTGNKTEIAVGYSTIYGDSVGGFAPIKDVPKTLVWELARWRNEYARSHNMQPPIPDNSISKPPSAELRPGQLDQDSLPDYEVLDAIVEAYITERKGPQDIVALGFDAEVVNHVLGLIDRSEWKRRQGAIGPKISSMSFGRDRRLPVTYVRPTIIGH
jgi:NAD+ synthase (glutamine-hydrolysing)